MPWQCFNNTVSEIIDVWLHKILSILDVVSPLAARMVVTLPCSFSSGGDQCQFDNARDYHLGAGHRGVALLLQLPCYSYLNVWEVKSPSRVKTIGGIMMTQTHRLNVIPSDPVLTRIVFGKTLKLCHASLNISRDKKTEVMIDEFQRF